MVDRAKKITELPAANSVAGSDYLVVVANTGGVPVTKRVAVTTFVGNNAANTLLKTLTPANSTITIAAGTLFYDASYLYIAVANNVLKRVLLETF